MVVAGVDVEGFPIISDSGDPGGVVLSTPEGFGGISAVKNIGEAENVGFSGLGVIEGDRERDCDLGGGERLEFVPWRSASCSSPSASSSVPSGPSSPSSSSSGEPSDEKFSDRND